MYRGRKLSERYDIMNDKHWMMNKQVVVLLVFVLVHVSLWEVFIHISICTNFLSRDDFKICKLKSGVLEIFE